MRAGMTTASGTRDGAGRAESPATSRDHKYRELHSGARRSIHAENPCSASTPSAASRARSSLVRLGNSTPTKVRTPQDGRCRPPAHQAAD